jgi:hypothetical protein
VALSTVTLTWNLKDFLQVGIPDSCVLYITPNSVCADTTDSLVLPALTRSVAFVGGAGSLAGIVANDSAALVPSGTSYEILIFDPANNSILVPPFAVQINIANGATQDLSTLWLNQAATPTPLVHYLQSANNLGDIASLPSAQTNLGLNSLATGPAKSIQHSFNPQFLSAGATYSASVNDLAIANCSSGNSIVNLPTAPADGSVVGIKLAVQNSPSGSTGLYSLTVNCGGADTFETTTGGTSANINSLNEAATWRYYASTGVWVRQWGVLSWSQVQKSMPKVLNVLSYGADPTGVADSTTAFNAAIATATGSAAPSSNSRAATVAVYFPAGSYKITSDLVIQSTLGFNFFGDGPELSILVASGTGFTTGPIVVDGSYAGRYGGFTLKGDTTEQVTNAFTLTWTTGAARSTTGNKICDIRVRNLNFVTGMNLAGVTNRQVDSTRLDCVVIGGGQTVNAWSNSGNWQQGFTFGNGTFANIYDQVLTRCDASNCYYGMYNNVSSFSLTGSQPANNYCDFYMNPGAQSTITNVQSQNAGQFVISPSNFSPQPNTFNDCQVKTSYLSPAGNRAILTLAGGQWNFNNFSASNTQLFTTVASGSNGGAINNIASWSSPSAGVLAIASSTGFPSGGGTVTVVTSTTPATITYTGVSGNTLTGCAYVSGGTGTVSTGGAVSMYAQGTVSVVGSSSVRPCTALFNNFTTNGTKVNAFSTVTNAIISVQGYNSYNPLTGNYTYTAGDVASFNTGGIWTTVGGPGIPPQVNYYTSGTNSYTIPAGAQTLDVTVVGGGSGGSSGAMQSSGGAGGGAGGAGGGVSRMQFQVSTLTSPVSCVVGAGGNGGAAVSSPGAGNSGVAGSTSTFGNYMWAKGGSASSGGSATNSVAVTGGAGGPGTCVPGQAGSTVTTSVAPTAATAQSTGGGGAGGGVPICSTTVAAGSNGGTITNIAAWATPSAGTLAVAATTNFPASGTATVACSVSSPATISYTGVTANTLTGCAYVSGGTGTIATGGAVIAQGAAQNGVGCTAPVLGVSSNSSAGGVVGGASPTNGNAPTAQGDTAPGGGGGAAAITSGTAQTGAAGQANSGAGGGGGGGASGGATSSGAGGAGGSGYVLIIAYFQ